MADANEFMPFYDTWARYAEEDAAQALDQFLNTRLGRNSRGDPVTRTRTSGPTISSPGISN